MRALQQTHSLTVKQNSDPSILEGEKSEIPQEEMKQSSIKKPLVKRQSSLPNMAESLIEPEMEKKNKIKQQIRSVNLDDIIIMQDKEDEASISTNFDTGNVDRILKKVDSKIEASLEEQK